MSNIEYKSDAQTEYDRNKFDSDSTSEVIGGKSNLKTSVSEGIPFCPHCESMMLPYGGAYKCNSCGYLTDSPTTNNSIGLLNQKHF